jgi:hypothetical protein
MPIPLEENKPIPSVKLPEIDNTVSFAIGHTKVVPWNDISTGNVKVGEDGKERTQDRVAGVVVSGTGVVGTKKDGYEKVAPGQDVTLYFSGHHRWEYIQAKKAHGTLNVGDICTCTYVRDEASRMVGGNAKHVWDVSIRAATGDEQQYVDQAEALYRRLSSQVLEPAASGGYGGSSSSADEEDPF